MISLHTKKYFQSFSFLSKITTASKPIFIVDYLINSLGLSAEKAATVSKRIAHLTSASKPDSVRHFLEHHGFTDPQIRTLISRYPQLLCTDVARTVGPNLLTLRQLSLAEPDLKRIVLRNPQSLLLRSSGSRIHFWKEFLNNDDDKLLAAFTKNLGLINLDIEKNIAPKIAFLKDYGFSEEDIRLLVARGNGFINKNTAAMGVMLKQAEDFGFSRGSPMFLFSLSSFSGIRSDTFKGKMELYRKFGWSEEEFASALLKAPLIVRYSEKSIRAKMEFLVATVGYTQKYISFRPTILGYSLEKRMVPRYHVMKMLKEKRLIRQEQDLYTILCYSEESFVEKMIMPYKDMEPTLLGTYIAARKGT